MYEVGFLASLLFSGINIVIYLMASWGRYGDNLRKIGLRPSMFSDGPVPVGGGGSLASLGRGIAWVTLTLFTAALSWIGVAWTAAMFLHHRSKRSGAPQEVAELAWRLRNTSMTSDEIVAAFEHVRQAGIRRSGVPEIPVEVSSS